MEQQHGCHVIKVGEFTSETPRVYPNSLSNREMESLTAICDTFVPSIKVSGLSKPVDENVAAFYRTSASRAGTPRRVAGLISERLNHPKKWLMRVALWLLSTCIGTLILCGRRSLSMEFPFCQSFSKLSQQEREGILISWSKSCISLHRMFFKAMKLLTLLVFFSQVDENNDNVSWKAIGYSGPDEADLKNSSEGREPDATNHESDPRITKQEEENLGPLHKGIIDFKPPTDKAVQALKHAGFSVSIPLNNETRQNRSNIFRFFGKSSVSSPAMRIHCDAVVVGSGSGGGVVAGLLAKSGYKVLVLEKGEYYARNNLTLLEGEAMDQMYLSGGLLATDDMGALILAGLTVGGGSTVNWSASIRTPRHVLKEWSNTYGLELFESELYKEALNVVCERMGVQSEVQEEGFNNMVLRRGCEELGFPVETIPTNAPADHYCGFCCLGCKKGRKKGTAETWLVDLVNSGNGAILPGCEALKVLHKKGRGGAKMATGVAFTHSSKNMQTETYVVQSKVTIVACGALSTPNLLKRSGLKNHNIGKHLRLHPVTMACGWFPEGKWPEDEKKSFEGGIMTAMSTVLSDTRGTGYGALIQTPALHPGMFAGVIPWTSGLEFKARMLKFSRTAHIFALARDQTPRGVMRSQSWISYDMDSRDEANLQEGIDKMLRILAAAGAEEIWTHNGGGRILDVKRVSSRLFEDFVREEKERHVKGSACSAHQMGSCRMGLNQEESAVKATGETWEVKGLYVADSSVFPTALGVNPMVTVMAIAYCVGKSAVDVLRRKKKGA